jgi:phosphatidylserine synthase
LIFVGAMMVSNVPTLAMKGWRITPIWVTPIYIAAALFVAALVTNTWLALSCAGVVYVASLPLGWFMYRQKMKTESAKS